MRRRDLVELVNGTRDITNMVVGGRGGDEVRLFLGINARMRALADLEF